MIQTVPGFDRLTIEPEKHGGQPGIRGYRFSVEDLLELLAAEWTFQQIHDNFPFLELEDILQTLGYAATLAHRNSMSP